ncbi:DUF2142 domain-containing protein [Pedococcus sp. 5OH_020]|uniref:DUF2142 domain-containing protein n=1 Tax=Pedococcus sp. 5OH_020 TaxID=2989814 RepID=UPI0022E9F1D2|nr:DUF2142 domain-containing protein [Pedococcus sp. 5OH_020]
MRGAHQLLEEGQPVNDTPQPANGTRRSARLAGMFVLPYFLLMVVWVASNPPGAAPDESDHLVKALGVGRLSIGSTYTGEAGNRLLAQRNASISRVVTIPARLAPDGYKCTAFKGDTSAKCLPERNNSASGTVQRVTPVGAYPPFLYLPAGVATLVAQTPVQAFVLARATYAVLTGLLLFAGAFQLVRWLGRWALLGSFVALTPMAVFSGSVVSTSGVEISAAFAVAATVVVVSRRPAVLGDGLSVVLLAVSAILLVLSRQMGILTLGVLLLIMAARLGPTALWRLLRRPSRLFAGWLLALIVACGGVIWWELTYDHPALTGSPLSAQGLRDMDIRLLSTTRSGIGNFGWLDTPLPQVALAVWVCMVVLVCGGALVLATKRDLWTLLTILGACLVTAYVVYSVVFLPIRAGLQGRHMLPMFMLLPLLSGVVLVERLREGGLGAIIPRLFVIVAVVAGLVQATSPYVNARRYAVGLEGPLWFSGHAQWAPPLGWTPWLLLAGLAAAALACFATRCCRDAHAIDGDPHHEPPLVRSVTTSTSA